MNGIPARGDPVSGGASASPESRRGCNARCPRCGVAFDCGVADASPCACGGVSLTYAHHRFIAARWSGCLCIDCLRAIAAGATS